MIYLFHAVLAFVSFLVCLVGDLTATDPLLPQLSAIQSVM
jgi:hypothetical protein